MKYRIAFPFFIGAALLSAMLMMTQCHNKAYQVGPIIQNLYPDPIPMQSLRLWSSWQKKHIQKKFARMQSRAWGPRITGIQTKLAVKRTKNQFFAALTLDACGSPGDGYDRELIHYLVTNKIKATLFISSRWIKKNKKTFIRLSKQPLFQIANHGWQHKPCSLIRRKLYGLASTAGLTQIYDEIQQNSIMVYQITGQWPQLFRAGTAYYDNVCVSIARDLGYRVIGYTILGDAGATYSAQQVSQSLLRTRHGDIILLHMNHPESGTAKGVRKALPKLIKRGFTFIFI